MKEGITSYNIEETNTEVEKIFINDLITRLIDSKGIRYEFRSISKDNNLVGLVLRLGETNESRTRSK